jgi:hypothetical protein
MPMRVLWRLCFQRSTNCSQTGSRRAHRMVPIVEAVDERLLLSGPSPYVGVAFETYVKEWSPTQIDEPWKSNQNGSPTSPAGRDAPWSSAGAEGHFRLYTYDSHIDAGQIAPKFPL